jgi:hypothetical protein
MFLCVGRFEFASNIASHRFNLCALVPLLFDGLRALSLFRILSRAEGPKRRFQILFLFSLLLECSSGISA